MLICVEYVEWDGPQEPSLDGFWSTLDDFQVCTPFAKVRDVTIESIYDADINVISRNMPFLDSRGILTVRESEGAQREMLEQVAM